MLLRRIDPMPIHGLRSLEKHEREAIEAVLAEEKKTHRTFAHLVGELEELEDVTDRLEHEERRGARRRLEQKGRRLARNLSISLTHLAREEKGVLREIKDVRSRVVDAIGNAIKKFEGHASR